MKKIEKKYVVVMNLGGGLWHYIVEVSKGKDTGCGIIWSDKSGDVGWKDEQDPRNSNGCHYYVFNNKKEAQLFFNGSKAFRSFMARFF